jgi:hypothetical protein
MGMWTTENQDTMKIVLRAFSDAAGKAYPGWNGQPSHAFEAGYLQSMVVEMLPHLPKRMQKVFIDDMVRATQKQEKVAIERMNKETV